MKVLRQLLTVGACLGIFAALPAIAAAEKKDIVLKGDAACTRCHDEADNPALLAIGKTRHGTLADSRVPTCTDCHGPSKDHIEKKNADGKPPRPDIAFTAKTKTSAEARNAACQSCHRADAQRSHWEGSIHQARDVTCSSCHKIHAAKDAVRDKRTQGEACFSCHKEQRIQVNKPSHHPLVEGKMGCSDCHNPHGSAGPKLMKRHSVVETCHTCHMEKRGPFLRNHQPVMEDCSICHNPHGTTAENLLKTRPPFLCHTCHSSPHTTTQPNHAASTANVTKGWWNGSDVTQGRACLNCHTQIHGSNNPGGASPNPQRLFR